ncbi:HRD1 [Candida pseudojiufengensis]|uniref:HRD1 n=1 Tax=Candida pseudojiufengensis TaxID=497109 RepID=UPI0022254610|nr:HRD1 [Candida pseudojiufengensis]KAI5962359.1 HRD1 [Candida pseudojiufengensis]
MFIIEFTDGLKLGIFINFIIFTFLLFNKLLQLALFGSLRIIEVEHLFEKLPIFAINLSLNMATAESNIILNVALMGIAMTFKMIHIIMFDRLDFLTLKLYNKLNEEIDEEFNSKENEIEIKYVTWYYLSSINFWLNVVLIFLDFTFAKFLVYDVYQGVNSVTCLLFGFQYAVQGVEALTNLAKLALGFYEVVNYKLKKNARERERELEETFLMQNAETYEEEEEEENIDSTIDSNTSNEVSTEDIVEPSGNLEEVDAEDPENDLIDDDDDDIDFVWENKPYYSKAIDISSALLTSVSYLCFIYLLTIQSGLSLPLSMLQGTYSSLRKAWIQITQLLAFIESSKRLDTQLPNATQSDLEENDNLCIICREDMHSVEDYQRVFKKPQSSRRCAKKLECNHILHMGCLKDWLERSDNCPLCRRKVFGGAEPANSTTNPAQANHDAPNHAPPLHQIPTNNDIPPQQMEDQSPILPRNGDSATTTTGTSTPRNIYNHFDISQSNFRRVSNDAMHVLDPGDREEDILRRGRLNNGNYSNDSEDRGSQHIIPGERFEIDDTIVESSSRNDKGSSLISEPSHMRSSNLTPTPTSATLNTNSSLSDFQTIHLPSSALLPPDWVLLPLERINNETDQDVKYMVSLTNETSAKLRIRHNDR